MSPFKRAAKVETGDVIVSPTGGKRTVAQPKDFGNRIVIVDTNGGESRHNPDDELEVE